MLLPGSNLTGSGHKDLDMERKVRVFTYMYGIKLIQYFRDVVFEYSIKVSKNELLKLFKEQQKKGMLDPDFRELLEELSEIVASTFDRPQF